MTRFIPWKGRALFILLASLALPSLPQAKEVPFEVLPWNGYKAALSLTYDDGNPIHLDVAIPEMEKRGLRGTFYLIAGRLTRVADWKKAAEAGQEIGNHTMTHRHVSELSPQDEKNEVVEAKRKLQDLMGVPVLTLAYPYVEISPGLKKWVEAENFAARGGGGYPYLTPDMNPDWFNLPSQVTMTAYAAQTYRNWVDEDLASGAWTILMIHAIRPADWYEPITQETYRKFLDYLVEKKKDLWTAPLGEVCAYWRAQKTLEAAEPQRDGDRTVIRWGKIPHFPAGVTLKLDIQGTGLRVSQGGKEVKPAAGGVYPVSFDAGELTLDHAAWRTAVESSATPLTPKPAVIDASAIQAAPSKAVLKVDDFESFAPSFGAGWGEACDGYGKTKLSPVPFSPLPGGSPLSPGHCAGMKGYLPALQAPWPWALLSLSLDGGGNPVDLSAYQALRFYTRGDGKTHTVALNKASVTDYCDFQANFTSPAQWTLVTLPFSDFTQPSWGRQLERKFNDVLKLSFSPGAGDSDFDFRIDDVEFLRTAPAPGP
jgi:peptidoglycan/xylan/chitin deacetylase (PgdA/CDA1 family)